MKEDRYGDIENKLFLKQGNEFIPFEGTRVDMYLQRLTLDNQCENCYVYVDKQGNEYIEVSDNNWRYFWECGEQPCLVVIPLQGKDLEIINARYEREVK